MLDRRSLWQEEGGGGRTRGDAKKGKKSRRRSPAFPQSPSFRCAVETIVTAAAVVMAARPDDKQKRRRTTCPSRGPRCHGNPSERSTDEASDQI
ncbi:hypothetical protein NHX12_023909 [Muraenolepis orangiensis]|uniref:Uncharacterized protein n=1 Tax=Muraenolepis orangiensis TaxID=630683 RepID=A0A9Q0IU88_9TELE|nr:hypothetical protein NHX12_023909 [Muraenolepis orangiensis]